MIKILKEGIKELRVTCPFCYCEFSYEAEDLLEGTLRCPCCGAIIEAKSNTKTWPIKDNMIYKTPEYRAVQKGLERQVEDPPSFVPSDNKINPCLSCPFYISYLSQGKVYVGDSPCQWCEHSGLRITCNSTGTSVNGVKQNET